MVARIHQERGSGSEFLDFKTGRGGTIEAEFLVQALQMRSGIWEPNWGKALDALRANKFVTDDDTRAIAEAYDLLRRIETTLRRFENKNVSALPAIPEEHERLAKRLGYKTTDDFVVNYHAARETIHTLYAQNVQARV